ncbi:MAG: carboxypeptidase-like regulatory domain-containing protein, partial [Acidobacteriota bacterium]
VIDSLERPLAEAEVQLVASGSDPAVEPSEPEQERHRARTTRDGRFRVSGPASESVDIVARAKGFAPLRVRGVRVPLGVAAVDLGTLVLAPGVGLAGRVEDPQGRPLAGAEIWWRQPTERFEPRVAPVALDRDPDAIADAAGRFELVDLEPGSVIDLWVDHDGFLGTSIRGLSAPDVTGPGHRPILAVLEPAGQIQGVVVSDRDVPLAEARVTLATLAMPAQPSWPSRTVITDAEGRFSLQDARPGELEVSAVAAGFQPAPPQQLTLAPSQELAGLRLVVSPGAALVGRVVSSAGEPVAEARVAIGGQHGDSDLEGHFELSGIPPGLQRLQVIHPGYNVLTLQQEITAGVNHAELRLAGGHPITGWVLDQDGSTVADAVVELEPLSRETFGGYRTRSDDGGAFRLARVAEGRYRVVGSGVGYVAAEPELVLEVAGDAVEGVELVLQAGARIQGEILGLDFEELAQVEVEARSERYGRLRGTVDYEGGYEIVDLSPGDWLVTAELGRGSRQARARVIIEPGVARVTRDLELDRGVVLNGQVLHGGEPLAGARVTLRAHDHPARRAVTAGLEGDFAIENLEPGSYRASVTHAELRVIHNEDVWIERDDEVVIEITTAELSGWVTSAGRAVPSATVMLRQILAGGSEGSAFGEPSAADGSFRFPRLPAGRFKLQVQHNAYRPFEEELEVAAGRSLAGFRVALEPAAGLDVMARLTTGARPEFLNLRGVDEQGRSFAATRVPDAEGYARFSSLPAGNWRLLISGTGGATISRTVTVPGEPLAGLLPAAGRLRVRVADLVELESYASLTLASAEGLRFQNLAWGGTLEQAWPVAAGRAVVEGLPAGVWNLRVEGPAGRVWTGVAVTTGGPEVAVTLQD